MVYSKVVIDLMCTNVLRDDFSAVLRHVRLYFILFSPWGQCVLALLRPRVPFGGQTT